ncbi:chemotaxis protein CheB, partial [Myxococcota bacterium]|nr:chemotaxis protein CheB [Myxococcota bacterium]
KPIRPLDLLERVEDGLTRLRISRRFLGLGVLTSDPPTSTPPAALKTPTPRTPTPKAPTPKAPTPRAPTPKTPTPRATLDARPLARGPYTALAVTASTGGPTALITFFEALNAASDVTIFVVLHGPEWMLRTYTQRLAKAARRPVHYVEAGEACQPGAVYLAAGDRHMRVKRRMGAPWVEAFDGPKENFVRPAADPLFHSVAEVYGAQAAAVVLTGMGRDGTRGAQAIAAAGGLICAQTPDSAVAPSMPTSVIRQEIVHHQGTPEGLAAQLSRRR